MGKWRKRLIQISVLGLILGGTGVLSASAAVKEGKPGETLTGDYAVIVNTSTTDAQSTGTLVFDESGNGASVARASAVKDPVGQDAQTGAAYPATRIASEGAYSVGTEKSISSPYNGMRTYVCIGENEYCYVWMEKTLKEGYDKQEETDRVANDMMQTYEGRPYETLKELAGGSLPWGKLSIMLETISNASGVYKYNSELTAIHINTPEAASYEYGSMGSRGALLVHEGQHALFHLMAGSDPAQPYTWLNEGISVAVMDYLWGGTDNSGWMDGIAGNTDIRNGSPLFYKNYRSSTAQDYGMPYLFVRYLIAQATGGYKPMQLFPNFYKVSAACRPDTYLERVLAQTGHNVSFGDLLTQFYTAIIAQESSGVYGFEGDSIVRQKVNNYPLYMGESGQAHSLAPTAAIMVKLENGAFTVPNDGGSKIRYMVVSGGRNVPVPDGGDGSSENPYEISDFNDLALIGNKPGAHYKLTQDIEANGQMNLTPTYFSGVLDGDGHRICGLTKPLVGKNSGTIQNLTVEAAFTDDLTGTQGVFTLANSGMIKDCMATGTVNVRMLQGQTSYMYPVFGVFAGENEVAGTIRGCTNRAQLTLSLPAMQSWIGGIAGIQTGIVKSCSSRGEIHVVQENGGCDVYVGGIAGKLTSMGMGGVMNSCIHTGVIDVTGGLPAIGQLCGLADSSVVNKGLGNCIVSCHAKQGNIPAVGSPQSVLSEDGILLTEDQIGEKESYSGWDFDSEWKMGDDGPERLGSSDIQEFGTVDTPTECYVGEQIYYWGRLTINGKSGAEISQDMVSGFDSSTAGVKTVQVRYLGKTAVFEVNVKTPGNISSFELPENVLKTVKTEYAVGERFNPAGLYFIATIDGNAGRMIYSGFEYEQSPLTAADKSVVITYFGQRIEIPITIKDKVPASLTVVSKPEKTKYADGQRIDWSGVRVQITYDNRDLSPVFGVDEFDKYGIRVAKRTSDLCVAIATNATLSTGDNNSSIWLYATDVMPNQYGSVSASLGAVTVLSRMRLQTSSQPILLNQQSDVYFYVTGGSGSLTAEIIEEILPPGVQRKALPQNGYTYFKYSGLATVPGRYVSKYRLTDAETGQIISADLTIQVQKSDEARIYMFRIPAQGNVGLPEDVYGEITETTVILRIPKGVDVSDLSTDIDFGYNAGTRIDSRFYSGTRHDFSSPITYILTAPDGVTKKPYTVVVEFYDPENEGSGGDSGAEAGGSAGSGGETSGGSGTGGSDTGTGSSGGSTGGSGTGSGSDTGPGSGGETSGGGSTGGTGAGSADSQTSGNVDTNVGQNSDTSSGQAVSPIYPKVGTKIKQGGAYYRITASSAQECTAELYRPVKKKTVTLKMASTVKTGGYTYKVTSIAANAFKNNPYLRKITIGKYVVSIGNQAFYGCKKLKTLTIPAAVKTIGKQAFARCTALTKTVIGKSVQIIGAKAFYGCKNLKLITVKGTALKKVKSGAVNGIHPKAVIRVPKKKRAAYRKLFKRKVS